MTDEVRKKAVETSYEIVKASIARLERGEKDKDDHIQVLELTIGRLVWLCKQPTDTNTEKQ